jgi:hypothetical protein
MTILCKWVLALFPLHLSLSATAAPVEKPNIVLVLMGNFGYGKLGVYGGGI